MIVRNGNAATIYLVAATEPASFSFHTKIHPLDLGTGNDVTTPREIHPQATLQTAGKIRFDPQNQWSRASLAFNNGGIYVGIGSHCDSNAGDISGWALRYDTDLNLTARFNTIEAAAGYELSSVWMSGYSPAAGTRVARSSLPLSPTAGVRVGVQKLDGVWPDRLGARRHQRDGHCPHEAHSTKNAPATMMSASTAITAR